MYIENVSATEANVNERKEPYIERKEPCCVEPHIYVMNLKKSMIKKNKQMRKVLNLVQSIYVIFDSTTFIPETIELHYADDELEDPYSLKGARVLHRVYQFPKVPIKFYKDFTAETAKLVLIYDNWKSKWHVHEVNEANE